MCVDAFLADISGRGFDSRRLHQTVEGPERAPQLFTPPRVLPHLRCQRRRLVSSTYPLGTPPVRPPPLPCIWANPRGITHG